MFAKTIVLSDAFLDMPMSARCLYFTLSMVADDDGFVNAPKSIMRQCGASNDDMNILLMKRFILAFESGVIVIKHWRVNNYLRSDRYVETKYKEELALLTLNDDGVYSMEDDGIPVGIPSGIPSIDKYRLDKKSIDNTCANKAFEKFWSAYPKKKNKADALKAFKKVSVPLDTLLAAIEVQKQSHDWNKDNGQFIPYPATWLNRGAWENVEEVEVSGHLHTVPDEFAIYDSFYRKA